MTTDDYTIAQHFKFKTLMFSDLLGFGVHGFKSFAEGVTNAKTKIDHLLPLRAVLLQADESETALRIHSLLV